MRDRAFRRFPYFVLLSPAVLLAAVVLAGYARADEETAAIEERLASHVRYLASDELEGRGIGTRGLDKAAEYIADQFRQSGLKTDLFDGTPFQKFPVTSGTNLGAENELALVHSNTPEEGKPERIELKLGEDFTPLALGGSGKLDLALVFAGYGISAKEEGYDDYAGVDVTGKAVVVLRHEPQQDDPESAFNGTKESEYAPFGRKVSNAFEHGASAVVFCTDEHQICRDLAKARKDWQEALDRLAEEHAKLKQVEDPGLAGIEAQRQRINDLIAEVQDGSDKLRAGCDPLLPFAAGGRDGGRRDLPVVACRRAPLDRILHASLDTDLSTLERQIDEGPAPHSAPLDGWRLAGQVEVERTETEVKNVVVVLEGEGPLADETLVIGAHYDHLGRRGGTAEKPGEVFNGADDNASGVAALIEAARTLAKRPQKPRRRIVFIAFAAEERGLLGSSYYVEHPLVPLENTVAMLNMDMVGRLRDDKLTIGGAGTAAGFGELLDRLNASAGFQLTKQPSGFGPSDHSSFYGKKIPVMHFFTGTHGDLHRPSDDFEKINVPGMRRVTTLVTEVATELAGGEGRPEYVSVGRARVPPSGGKRPYFGSIPDFSHTGPGYGISGVAGDSPAEKAGLRGGDVIVRLGESKIGSLDDFDSALRKHQGGERVQTAVLRDGKEQVFEVTLDPPR